MTVAKNMDVSSKKQHLQGCLACSCRSMLEEDEHHTFALNDPAVDYHP